MSIIFNIPKRRQDCSDARNPRHNKRANDGVQRLLDDAAEQTHHQPPLAVARAELDILLGPKASGPVSRVGESSLESLPIELFLAIISDTSLRDVENLRQVSKTISSIVYQNRNWLLRLRADRERDRLRDTVFALTNLPSDLFQAVQIYSRALGIPGRISGLDYCPARGGNLADLYSQRHAKSKKNVLFLLTQLQRVYDICKCRTTRGDMLADEIMERLYQASDLGLRPEKSRLRCLMNPPLCQTELDIWKRKAVKSMCSVADERTLDLWLRRARREDIFEVEESPNALMSANHAGRPKDDVCIPAWAVIRILGGVPSLPRELKYHLRARSKEIQGLMEVAVQRRGSGEGVELSLFQKAAVLEDLVVRPDSPLARMIWE